MIHFTVDDATFEIPPWVNDLESFRRWTDDEAFPETGHISFLNGVVWIDMSKEQLFDHIDVKSEVTMVLRSLAQTQRVGRYLSDGVYLSNVEANVSNQADGVLLSKRSVQQQQVRVVEGKRHGHVELEGTPEMVLEVVSDGSVSKDNVVLRQAYAEAGIKEYWLIDARQETLLFDVLRLTTRGYVATRKRSGWVRSDVFDRWFRLSKVTEEDGFPGFRLDVRSERPE